MADAVTAAIGAMILVGYMFLIAAKLNDFPLWIVTIVGLACMLWAFWGDDWKPVLKRDSNSK